MWKCTFVLEKQRERCKVEMKVPLNCFNMKHDELVLTAAASPPVLLHSSGFSQPLSSASCPSRSPPPTWAPVSADFRFPAGPARFPMTFISCGSSPVSDDFHFLRVQPSLRSAGPDAGRSPRRWLPLVAVAGTACRRRAAWPRESRPQQAGGRAGLGLPTAKTRPESSVGLLINVRLALIPSQSLDLSVSPRLSKKYQKCLV